MNKKNNRKGFTILELVIVIAVIAILATVLIPTFGSIIEKANNSKLLQELKNEYTEYAVTVAPESIQDDIVIKIGEKYYNIVNGAPELDTDGTTVKEGTKPAVDAYYWDAEAEPANAWKLVTE